VIAAVAVLVAAVAIGVLVVNESSEPKPVAQLTPQTDPDQGAIPLDEETATNFGVTEADFVSYGSYGELQIWSATTREAKRCLAMVAENRIIMVRCAAPTFDPVADVDFPSNMFPPAPSGEPTFNIRFVLRDGVVDVYLARILRAGSTDTSRATTPELGLRSARMACPRQNQQARHGSSASVTGRADSPNLWVF
jgi:hypothetical protein